MTGANKKMTKAAHCCPIADRNAQSFIMCSQSCWLKSVG